MRELYGFQKRAVKDLLNGRKICLLMPGAGKTAVMFTWLKAMGKKKVVIVTTASKFRSGDMYTEAKTWCGDGWIESLDSFEVLSWHKLKQFVDTHGSFADYAVAFDEVQKCKNYSTGMGKSFRKVCKTCDCWTGYTATPGDQWKDFIAYFEATHLVKSKWEFQREYCIMQSFRGFPEIVKYVNTDVLQRMWDSISTSPSTEQLVRELPPEVHRVIEFPTPKHYKSVRKTRKTLEGEFIDTTMGLCHYLRQICFSKEKRDWIADFIENLGTNCVFFCNYKEEEDVLCDIAASSLPKGARVWRIDGEHHEIPTADTIGKYDIVVAHYLSGGEALNLQFMHYWCSVSPNYSYSTSVQARGRIKRIGQKMTMFYYYLKATGSIEDDIYACLRAKSDFSEKVWAENIDAEDNLC